jgi:hypothetical protein
MGLAYQRPHQWLEPIATQYRNRRAGAVSHAASVAIMAREGGTGCGIGTGNRHRRAKDATFTAGTWMAVARIAEEGESYAESV